MWRATANAVLFISMSRSRLTGARCAVLYLR